MIQAVMAAGKVLGKQRIASVGDVVARRVAFALRKAGVTTRSLKTVVQFVRENEGIDKPLAESRLVVSGRDVLIVRNDRQLVSALSKPGQSCLSFVVDLPRTLGELAEVADITSSFAVGVARPERALGRARKQADTDHTSEQRRR